jgi:hypothetical protein
MAASRYRLLTTFSPLAGINLNKHQHLTNAILYRWIGLITGESDSYKIIPVNVKRVRTLILLYDMEPTGEVLPCDDTKVLPGDYSVIPLDGKVSSRIESVLSNERKEVQKLEAGKAGKLSLHPCPAGRRH